MAVVFIEPQPKGQPAGTPVVSYAIETDANHVLKDGFDTQDDAINWAKTEGHSVHVARVRNTDKGNPDHWREA